MISNDDLRAAKLGHPSHHHQPPRLTTAYWCIGALVGAAITFLLLPFVLSLAAVPVFVGALILLHKSLRELRQEPVDELAFIDELTRLPNRRSFLEALRTCLNTPLDRDEFTAVFFLDLDKFKGINDALGHLAGDRFLLEISARIRNCVGSETIVARFAGDEFTILIPSVKTREEVIAVAQRIMNQFSEEVLINGHKVWANTSMGIAMVRSPRPNADDLLSMADAALYHAKAQGRGKYILFEPNLPIPTARSLSLDADIRTAVENRQMILHYQPIVRLHDLRIVGLEALIRWEHPHLGLLKPDAFIHLAEETGVIKSLGEWVIETACERLSAWQGLYGSELTVSVNLSALQFRQKELLTHIAQASARAGLESGSLQLEITETVLMDDDDQTMSTLTELRNRGFDIVIDDFGVGYSSLSYLRRFEIDALKLDRSFVVGKTDARSRALTKGTIQLAHSLGALVIAEGIETPEHLQLLRDVGCDHGQGFLLGKPMTEKQLLELVTNHGLTIQLPREAAAA